MLGSNSQCFPTQILIHVVIAALFLILFLFLSFIFGLLFYDNRWNDADASRRVNSHCELIDIASKLVIVIFYTFFPQVSFFFVIFFRKAIIGLSFVRLFWGVLLLARNFGRLIRII
jgi:hypothetical protein